MGCDQGDEFKDSTGRGGTTSCKMEQLVCSMGQEWREVGTRASKATTPSKGFYI